MSAVTRDYLQPSPDELGSYVLKGVWKRYDEQPYQSLKWTLDNVSALLVVACLASLIALAQSQCWSLVRFIIAQCTKSPRLPGDSRPEPLLRLSQSHALTTVIPVLSRWTLRLFDRTRVLFRIQSHRQARSPRTPDDEPVESPFFGLASILNISFFLVMQVAVPYWLTEGALGTPIVKSTITDECLKSKQSGHLHEILNRETRADEIFHLCRDVLNAGCDSPYHLSEPIITKTRPKTCPFGGDICLDDAVSFEITHWNISASEMGVNSRSELLMNHRLTCAPVSLDPFLWTYNDGSVIYVPEAPSEGQIYMLFDNVSLTLATTNGPNKFSNESSGLKMVEKKGSFDLTVLPRFTAGTNYFPDQPPLELNRVLQRNDGQSFLVVYRAGTASYSQMIDDPFFSAHNRFIPFSDHPDIKSFYADAEATALGCVEQFQYCFPPSGFPRPCTEWGARNAQFGGMLTYLAMQYTGPYKDSVFAALEDWNDQFSWSISEMLALFKLVPEKASVYNYLTMRIDFHKMVPLIQRKTLMEENRWIDDAREQWVLEVETWFMKAWLSGLLSIQDGALYTISDFDAGFSDSYLREWKLCGRILFHDKDFTNVNWIGLWATMASLMLLCLTGNQINAIHDALKSASKALEEWRRRMRILSLWGKLSGWMRKERRSPSNAIWFISQPGTVWNISSIFQSFSRRRPWYGTESGSGSSDNNGRSDLNVATLNAAEMDDLELPATTAPGRDGHGPCETGDEFWDNDDPI
jgi:hypothetical protein